MSDPLGNYLVGLFFDKDFPIDGRFSVLSKVSHTP